jgi:hypothetical protein
MHQLAFDHVSSFDNRIVRTHFLVGDEITSLAIEPTDGQTVITVLSRKQMIDLRDALDAQLAD